VGFFVSNLGILFLGWLLHWCFCV